MNYHLHILYLHQLQETCTFIPPWPLLQVFQFLEEYLKHSQEVNLD